MWAVYVAGTAVMAAGAIYQGNAVKAGNELKKRQVDINIKQAEIDAAAAANDKLEMLEYVQEDAITRASMMQDPGSSASIQAILNDNYDKVMRDNSLLMLKRDAQVTIGGMEKQALDFAGDTAVKAGYINATGTVLQSWGMSSMLGGTKSLPNEGFTGRELHAGMT